MNTPINAKEFGLAGDGIADDTNAFRDMHGEAQLHRRAIYLPYGDYRITDDLSLSCDNPVVIYGDSQQASRLLFDNCPGLLYSFYQHGIQQPVGIVMRNLGLSARGACGAGLSISYGNPSITNDHYRGAVSLRDVSIESNDLGHWNTGVKINGAWNATLDNVYASGNPAGGVWNDMAGAGLVLEGMCVNTHVTNSRFNFWATGVYAHGIEHNHEGMFFTNCSIVAAKRGVWIAGNPAISTAPRISSFSWQGGLVECRVGGVYGGSAAFHLQNVWDAFIGGAHMVAETLDCPETTYGVIAQDCEAVTVNSCGINAFSRGFLSTGGCRGLCVTGNVFTSTGVPVTFSQQSTTSIARNNTDKSDSYIIDKGGSYINDITQ